MIRYIAIWILEPDPISIEGCAQRTSGVTRSRRDEDALESRFCKETRVGDAVQCNATSQAEVRNPGLLVERSSDVHQDVFQNLLYAGGAIGEPLPFGRTQIDCFIGAARRTEKVDESR